LRTIWNWARRDLDLMEEFPGGGLDYAKIEEGLPFMTWEEAARTFVVRVPRAQENRQVAAQRHRNATLAVSPESPQTDLRPPMFLKRQ
jgi:hypothetical protein